MAENKAWDKFCKPPKDALKNIAGGRLRGMTDVNPQWRYKAMHDVYGPCGEGWKYEIVKVWNEQGLEGQIFTFAHINVCVRANTESKWSDPIPGIGGSMLIEKDKSGLHHNDEAVKMAVTDALSVALKMLGVAADIYMGRWDGTKYKEPITPTAGAWESLDDDERTFLEGIADNVSVLLNEGNVAAACARIDAETLQAEEKTALWTRFDSKQRAAMKKHWATPAAYDYDAALDAMRAAKSEAQLKAAFVPAAKRAKTDGDEAMLDVLTKVKDECKAAMAGSITSDPEEGRLDNVPALGGKAVI